MLEDIYNILWQLANYLAELMLEFVQWMTTSLSNILNWIQQAWNTAMTAINNTLAFVRDLIADLVGGLYDFMNTMVNQITTAFQTAWNIIRDAVTSTLNTIGNFASNLFANIRAQISTIVDQIKFIFTSFIDRVEQAVAGILNFIVDTYNAFVGAVQDGISSILTFAQDTLTKLGDVVTSSLQALVTGPAAVFEALSTRFNDLGAALRETVGELVVKLGNVPEQLVDAVKEAIDRILGGLIEWSNAPEMAGMMDALTAITTAQVTPADYQGFIGGIFKRFSPQSSLGRGIVFVMLMAAAALPALLSIGSIYAQPMTQALAREFPYQLLATPDVVAAWKRGLIGQATALDILKRHGFTEADAATMFDVAETIPDALDALHFMHRGLISEGDVTKVFKDRGFTSTWAAVYKEASFIIPPPADLILMAVREVFSPEVAQRFGLFQDFPEEFGEWAEKQGVSRDWALRYWGAHWGLPSPQMGFEMFHRGIIEKPDLELLLRSLDVMPFWRDRLIQLAYNPFTRVDIRRMHQLGVLTDADVHRAHLDLGYSPEKAALLSEFVIRLNRNAPGEDDAELGRLTRSAILGFYEDGILARDRAHQLLTNLGITPEAGALYLDASDNDQQRKERKAETDLILAQATAGVITFAQAQDRLSALGLETGEIQKALTQLARAEQSRTKIPSRDDGERFLRLGLINGAQYFDLLLRLGYSNQWATIYVQAVVREVSNAQVTQPA